MINTRIISVIQDSKYSNNHMKKTTEINHTQNGTTES